MTVQIFFLLSVFLLLSRRVHSQQKRMDIRFTAESKRTLYAVNHVKKAAEEKQYSISQSSALTQQGNEDVIVTIVSSANEVTATIEKENLKTLANHGWQCYAIRTRNSGKQKLVYVLADNDAGALYGALDIAEAIRFDNINAIGDSDNKPYLERRGIKFNIPLDLRTPSYTDPSDAAQQNIPNVWDKGFWEIFWMKWY